MTKNHNYFKQLLNIAEEISKGKLGVHTVSVAHDDWCNFLKNNKKECNCNPEVSKGVKE